MSYAAVPQKRNQQAPGFYRATLGAFEITALCDGIVPRRLETILHNPQMAPAEYGAEYFSVNAYLINTGAHLVLVDAGAGESMGATSGMLQANLRTAGYQSGQIDTILLTHIHRDHSGGLSFAGVRQFPNATLYVDARDLENFVTRKDSPGDSEDIRRAVSQSRSAFDPYLQANRVVAFKQDGEIVPGITSSNQPGHTPGHTAFLVQSEGHKMLFWGDIIHAAEVQFEHPEVTVSYDTNPAQAAQTRLRQFEHAADAGLIVASDHISFPGLGHVRREGSAYRWVPLPYNATVSELDPK